MLHPRAVLSAILLLLAATPARAAADDQRDYCPSRPGLGTTPCTIAPGRVSVETGLADWQRSDTPDARVDTVLFADTVVRAGVTDHLELLAGWTAVGIVRSRDKASGAVARTTGVGDLMLGAKLNLANPGGDGISLAIQPYVSAPVGRQPIGSARWEGGILAPTSVALNDRLTLDLQPELDRVANQDLPGHHWAYSGTIGLAAEMSDGVNTMLEFQAERDDEPGDHATSWLGALSVGWMPSDDMQLDVGTIVGLDRDAPGLELYVGISRRF